MGGGAGGKVYNLYNCSRRKNARDERRLGTSVKRRFSYRLTVDAFYTGGRRAVKYCRTSRRATHIRVCRRDACRPDGETCAVGLTYVGPPPGAVRHVRGRQLLGKPMRPERFGGGKVSAVVVERVRRHRRRGVRLQRAGPAAVPGRQRVRSGGHPADHRRQRILPQRFCGQTIIFYRIAKR